MQQALIWIPHFANVSYDGLGGLAKLTGYGYFLEYEDAAANSTQTIGGSLTGAIPVDDATKLSYRAEYAQQSDYGNNTSNFDADYYIGELGIGQGNWKVSASYEVLGSDDGNNAVQTKIGLLHKHNGWADIFLGGTPVNGLVDQNVKASYTVKSEDLGFLNGVKFDARYHMFEADHGGADYGEEFNLLVAKKIMKNYSVAFKMADYNADEYSTDTQKMWLILGAKF